MWMWCGKILVNIERCATLEIKPNRDGKHQLIARNEFGMHIIGTADNEAEAQDRLDKLRLRLNREGKK